MKYPFMAAVLASAFSGASAQSSVTVYGALDAGLIKRSGAGLAIGKRDANTLGFRGAEDLGGGLKALFHAEIRYEPDTGNVESNVRPLFQGQSRVGLQGGFGTVRIGRGLSAYMESIIAFDPFHGTPSPAGFYTDLAVAGFTSQPLDAPGNSFNRMSNAIWYNSPERFGLQFNATVGSREANGTAAIVGRGTAALPQYSANAMASANPYSISATYKRGIFAAMAGVERNGIESDVTTVAASITPLPPLKLMAIYSDQDRGHTMANNAGIKSWVLGANYSISTGKILAGYGQKDQDGAVKVKQASLGYEHTLSKRTYLYADVSNKKGTATVRHYDLGIRHNF